jgi:hypothetical protein
MDGFLAKLPNWEGWQNNVLERARGITQFSSQIGCATWDEDKGPGLKAYGLLLESLSNILVFMFGKTFLNLQRIFDYTTAFHYSFIP